MAPYRQEVEEGEMRQAIQTDPTGQWSGGSPMASKRRPFIQLLELDGKAEGPLQSNTDRPTTINA